MDVPSFPAEGIAGDLHALRKEVADLRACLGEVMGLMALPAIWSGQQPQSILESLCEALEAVLPVDLCFASAEVLAEEPPASAFRALQQPAEVQNETWRSFVYYCGSTSPAEHPELLEIPSLGLVRAIRVQMGYYGRRGFVCVASRKEGFPNPEESVYLRTAVSLAAGALNSARLAAERELASRAKDEFLAMLGHELRNPLAPIVTTLKVMSIRNGNVHQYERQVIERQVAHLTRLIDDLLDIARITRGKIELQREPLEISAVIAKAIETVRPLIEQRQHALETFVPERHLRVEGDFDRLTQALSNLLINAAKYTDPGGRISLRALRSSAEVRVTVEDNGSGIPPELLPRLFDLFSQGKMSADRAHGGLGIGLAVVKTMVEKHGGRVEVHSDGPGRGSAFSICLPEYQEDRTQPLPVRRALTWFPIPKPREEVVVVDDNRDAAHSIAELLRAWGYTVTTAYDAFEALQCLDAQQPRTMLIDIGLPGMDGYELAKRVQKRLGHLTPRLIALSGYGLQSDIVKGRAAGFEEYLVKPVDSDRLLKVLQTR